MSEQPEEGDPTEPNADEPAQQDPDEPAEPDETQRHDTEADDHRRQPPPPGYEEVTLADLLDVLIRRRRLVVGTLVVVLLATVALTAATPTTYEAEATILPTNERAEIISIMQSESFAADAAQRLGVVDELGDGNATRAGQALASSVTVREGTRSIGDSNKAIITIHAEAPTAKQASARANTWTATLADWRPYLENVTRDKNWQAYYEDAGKDEQQAKEELDDLVANMGYYQPLDAASPPDEPTSPDWRLNVSLGATLGVMLALFVPFLVEGVSNALEDRNRDRDDRPD